MAITGEKKESAGSYKRMYGFGAFDILGVNLSNEALKELGFYVKDEDLDKEREFTSEEDGVQKVQLEFACKGVGKDGKLRRFSFWLSNTNARNSEEKERALYKFINDQGRTAWSTNPKSYEALNPDYSVYFTGEDDSLNPRPAKRGEEEFMLFMRACMAIDFKNGGTIKYNLKKLLNGNFKELQEDLKSEFLTPIIVATTIRMKDTDEGKKEIESFYQYGFAPSSNLKLLNNKKVWEEADVKEIRLKIEANKKKKGKDKDYVSQLEELIVKMTDPNYPCKDMYHLGIMKDFDASNHLEASDAAIVQEEEPVVVKKSSKNSADY